MVFTGRATYDTDGPTGAFRGLAEDVDDIVSMISPYETPFLDAVGDADHAAQNTLHEWMEEKLGPSSIINTVVVASVTTATSALFVDASGNAVARYLQPGMILKLNATGEFLQISGVDTSNNVVTFTRAFGGTTATSLGISQDVLIVGPAALEGSAFGVDTSRSRERKQNYLQIFKKDIEVSGTMEAVSQLGGIDGEFNHQVRMRLRECLRDLEKSVIQGISSGNSIGSSTAYRSMTGVLKQITTNVVSTGATSVTASWLNDRVKQAWDNGATDTDLIVADSKWKNLIDGFNDSRIQVIQSDGVNDFRRKITTFESTYGVHKVMLSRWMPTNSLMVVSSDRIKIVPLRGRSFQVIPMSRIGDGSRGSVLGEYTCEVRNQEGCVKAGDGSPVL